MTVPNDSWESYKEFKVTGLWPRPITGSCGAPWMQRCGRSAMEKESARPWTWVAVAASLRAASGPWQGTSLASTHHTVS